MTCFSVWRFDNGKRQEAEGMERLNQRLGQGERFKFMKRSTPVRSEVELQGDISIRDAG